MKVLEHIVITTTIIPDYLHVFHFVITQRGRIVIGIIEVVVDASDHWLLGLGNAATESRDQHEPQQEGHRQYFYNGVEEELKNVFAILFVLQNGLEYQITNDANNKCCSHGDGNSQRLVVSTS